MGEVVVFRLDEREIPIVHRILRLHETETGQVDLLTKGDNNQADDRALYPRGQMWLNRRHVIGRAKGFLPYIGMVTIMMNDYPQLKYAVIAMLALFVITGRDNEK